MTMARGGVHPNAACCERAFIQSSTNVFFPLFRLKTDHSYDMSCWAGMILIILRRRDHRTTNFPRSSALLPICGNLAITCIMPKWTITPCVSNHLQRLWLQSYFNFSIRDLRVFFSLTNEYNAQNNKDIFHHTRVCIDQLMYEWNLWLSVFVFTHELDRSLGKTRVFCCVLLKKWALLDINYKKLGLEYHVTDTNFKVFGANCSNVKR